MGIIEKMRLDGKAIYVTLYKTKAGTIANG